MRAKKVDIDLKDMPSKIVVTADGDRMIFVPEGTWVEAMGVTAAALTLGVSPSNIDAIADLPEAAQRTERGRLWRASDIRALAKKRAKR